MGECRRGACLPGQGMSYLKSPQHSDEAALKAGSSGRNLTGALVDCSSTGRSRRSHEPVLRLLGFIRKATEIAFVRGQMIILCPTWDYEPMLVSKTRPTKTGSTELVGDVSRNA